MLVCSQCGCTHTTVQLYTPVPLRGREESYSHNKGYSCTAVVLHYQLLIQNSPVKSCTQRLLRVGNCKQPTQDKLRKINLSGRITLGSTRCLNFQTLEFRFSINFVYKLYLVDYTKVPGSLWTAPYKPV